ncbi:hypothetical protein [Wolbachia endosymbiont of Bemisia tabaci]|uniref:hypothetical protein n=1 Tax=Wolbachia endosymbiont of Bemisia tabaci TaxID=215173 RepID=UPI000D55F532|nr:hypothetical protein [Wolbachia endosymbiont of Bemisia tabaci]
MKKVKLVFIPIIFLLFSLICSVNLHAYKEENVSERVSWHGISAQEMRQFLVSLKNAVHSHDSQAFSKFLYYPCYWYGEEHIRINSPEQFIESYDKFITDSIKQVIKEIEFNDLFVNTSGIMMGRGHIWSWGIRSEKGKYSFGIMAINPCASGECECKNNCDVGWQKCTEIEPGGVCEEGVVIYGN